MSKETSNIQQLIYPWELVTGVSGKKEDRKEILGKITQKENLVERIVRKKQLTLGRRWQRQDQRVGKEAN